MGFVSHPDVMYRVDAAIDNIEVLDRIWPILTPYQAAVSIFIMAGYSRLEIAEHFEWSRQRVDQHIQAIRRKVKANMK